MKEKKEIYAFYAYFKVTVGYECRFNIIKSTSHMFQCLATIAKQTRHLIELLKKKIIYNPDSAKSRMVLKTARPLLGRLAV